jgi:glycosyltransferase involved in cell wall biosynthesis
MCSFSHRLLKGVPLCNKRRWRAGCLWFATRNAGAEDLLEDRTAGFLVPIRSPESIAEKLQLLENNREILESMSLAARAKAAELSWLNYRSKIVEVMTAATQI